MIQHNTKRYVLHALKSGWTVDNGQMEMKNIILQTLECGPMPNVMAAQPKTGGTPCESSIIPFLVPCHKVWLTPLLQCRANILPIYGKARLGHKVNFARGEIPSGGKSPKNVHIVHQSRRQPNIVQILVGLL